MIRSALILAGAVATACVGCVPAPAPPPPPPTGAGPRHMRVSCNENDIRGKITGVTGFSAAKYGNCVSQGVSCAANDAPSAHLHPLPSGRFADAIAAVFRAAPEKFKNEMCRLSAIYIDLGSPANNSFAWGMRESQQSNPPTHIGLNHSLFAAGPSASEVAYENDLLSTLLQAPNWKNPPQYISAANDGLTMKLMSAMAHEIGHIVWWRDGVASQTCSGNGFFSTWNNPIYNPHQFHAFGQSISGNTSTENLLGVPFQFDDIVSNAQSFNPNNRATAGMQVETVYGDPNLTGSARWASLFAFVAPDEDFIETYKLNILYQAGMSSMKVQMPNGDTIDVIAQNLASGGLLTAKANWINNCYQPQP